MGEVYRAHDDQLDRDVALKVLPAAMLAGDAARKRFRKEALVLAKLNHPRIATIHEFGSQDGVDFLVMELIPGKSLKEILKDGRIPENQLQLLGLQLTEGLAAAHEQGVIHRDLKPANIMITSDGRLKILDFGLAKLVEGATAADLGQSSTRSDAMPGTLPYMAPEQLRGGLIDARTDVYATGALLYEASTGQRPFPGTNAALLIESILHQRPRPPCEVNPRLSPNLQAILLKALEKDPENRYSSIQELHLALERLKEASAKTTTTITLELSQPPPLEMAHVLFVDLVRYSVLPMEEQRLRLHELQKIVRSSTEFVRAKSSDQLISLHSGDGMALVFFGDPEAPVRCAVELSRALTATPEIKLRMGINTGPVYRVADINAARNVSGGGINLAQRVMDCGDAGHILVSKAVADVLMQLSHWSSSLHDLGDVEVKHGVHVHVYSFYMEGVGNPALPSKLKPAKTPRKHASPEVRRSTAPRAPSGSSQRQGRAQHAPATASPAEAQVPQSSASTQTARINVPKVRRWIWLCAVVSILVLGAVALSVPTVRDTILHVFSSHNRPPAGIPSLEEGKHVIVLPFDVQGDRDTLGYVAEGLEEEFSRKLSALPALHVVSASSANEQAKDQKIDLHGPPLTIARNFGVNLILHGTIQEAGGWTRVTVDFEDIPDARPVLTVSQSYPAAEMKLPDLEDQVHNSIVKELKLRPSRQARMWAARPTSNSDAYDHYLQGRYASSHYPNAPEIQNAIGLYTRAIQEDSQFALAYVGLSDAYRAMFGQTNEPSWIQKAFGAAQQAQGLNDALPEVHLALGDAYRQLGNTLGAVAEFNRARKLSPNSDQPWIRLGRAYEGAGEGDQAIDAYSKAIKLDPYSLINRNELGAAYYNDGDYEKALAEFSKVTDLDPSNYFGYMNTGAVHLAQGKFAESIQELEKALTLARDGAPDNARIHSNLGTANYYMGRYAESVREDEKAVKISPTDYNLLGNLADTYRWSEKKKKAAETYRRAIGLATKQLELNPKNADVLGDLALYYAKSGNLLQAEDYIRSARSIDPSNCDLIFYEATVRMIAKQTSEALESLRLALDKRYTAELVEADPEFSSLRNNPDFQKLITKYSTKSN